MPEKPGAKTASFSQIDWEGAPGQQLSLVVYHRDGAEAVKLVPGRPLTVGRVAPADLVVPDPSLSRQHARFVLLGNEVVVEDLGSTNGTWLDGESIDKANVPAGRVVTLGATAAVVQGAGGGPQLGLEGHDQFLAALERELGRARYFARRAALVMVRASDKGHVSGWLAQVQAELRPIDRLALYSADSVEVLMPELGADEAAEVAARLTRAGELVCAISAYPESATSAERLIESCRQALRRDGAPVRVAEPSTAVVFAQVADEEGLVAESPAMKQALVMARRVARGIIPVLLHGETGTGKEVLSRFIHDHGPRKNMPLVAVNCAAIPPQLVESTLFGHEKGAFTGAAQATKGVFEAADGGTVLLDEIGELPPAAQAALLRVLETKKITRVGSTREIEVDVRIMAATHRNLEEMSRTGEFREDLLYRLNALTLDIPPLRERQTDVMVMAERFLEQASRHAGRSITGFDAAAIEALEAYAWPGNVRELRNAIERAVVIAEHDVILLADLPRRVREATSEPPEIEAPALKGPGSKPPVSDEGSPKKLLWCKGESFRACMERLEAEVLVIALQAAGGNQTEAARLLEMPRRTIVHKIRALGIKKLGYGVDE